MELDSSHLEDIIFEYIDQIKILISPEIWGSVLLDCSKNELFILLLLYRRTDVNMTQIADYIQVPLNTATGIVARMEKKQMVLRERNREDKRVVTIKLTGEGREQIEDIIKTFLYYGEKILGALSPEELTLAGEIMEKVIITLREEREEQKEKTTARRVKRIEIE